MNTTADAASVDGSRVKCVVWDLDNTIWDGILMEDSHVEPSHDVIGLIRMLDERGVLHSIASRNDHETAMRKLDELGMADLFLHPQITWNAKSTSVKIIAESLNIGTDAIVFVDDDDFERHEVSRALPSVRCVHPSDLRSELQKPEYQTGPATAEAKQRRRTYQQAIARDRAREEFEGTDEDFLATLRMRFEVNTASKEDLSRISELVTRTNQLNSTGRMYPYDELESLIDSDDHRVYVATLSDVFGDYGKIGLSVVETASDSWRLRLLLMSCRVMSRGVGTVLLNHVMSQAKGLDKRFFADFVDTDRNRLMYVTYKFAGFREIERSGDEVLLESDLTRIQPHPSYMTVISHVVEQDRK